MDKNIPLVDDVNPLFTIRGLVKTFPNGFTSLSGIDLDIYQGRCTLIAGANGSGKTVLMKILAGLLDASEGDVLYRGKPLAEYTGKRGSQKINTLVGLIFQDADAQILGETVEEDIRFGPENLKLPETEIKRRLEETLLALELEDKREFNTRHLSGGEKRRLAAASVLAMGSETIIMDEPFANLDWPGVLQVQRIISSLKENGKSVIILSHELEKVIFLADSLVILEGGKVRAQGECEAVLDNLDPAWGVRDPRQPYTANSIT